MKKNSETKVNKNDMKKLECVILLNGNFVVIPTTDDKKKELVNLLYESKKNSSKDPNLYMAWGEDICIVAKEVVGWYFRVPVESSTQQLMKFIEKKLPDTNEGDGWKGQ
jgi:hypothetical protein